jgi:UDP-2,3-diacylglucosamine hydrolase
MPDSAATPAVPFFAGLTAPESWRAIDFLSDLHLSTATPHTFDALEGHLRFTDADAVFILGDLFDVWVGDDARHSDTEAHCAGMLSEAASRLFIAFMRGNRDFLVGRDMLLHCGINELHDPTVLCAFGQRLLLTHGDALCLSDTDYQAFRAETRSPAWQQKFLSQPLEKRREIARGIRAESERRKAAQHPAGWADVDGPAAIAWLQAADAPQMIHGHTHMPADHLLAPGLSRHVLSDWDFDHPGASRADVLRWQADGLSRTAPASRRQR